MIKNNIIWIQKLKIYYKLWKLKHQELLEMIFLKKPN